MKILRRSFNKRGKYFWNKSKNRYWGIYFFQKWIIKLLYISHWKLLMAYTKIIQHSCLLSFDDTSAENLFLWQTLGINYFNPSRNPSLFILPPIKIYLAFVNCSNYSFHTAYTCTHIHIRCLYPYTPVHIRSLQHAYTYIYSTLISIQSYIDML